MMDATSNVAVASFPDHATTEYGLTGIVSVRLQPMDLDDLDNVTFLSPPDTQINGSRPHAARTLMLVVIERGMRRTSDLLPHYYSPLPEVVQFLRQSELPVLREDAAIVAFAAASRKTEGLAERALRLRTVPELEKENLLLRDALGISRRVPVTRDVLAVASRKSDSPQRSPCQQNLASAPESTRAAVAPGVLPDEPEGARPPLHSPLQWDTETEAAINARTKYRAFKTRYNAPSPLDKGAQEHLVNRLHDKALDTKRRRLAEIEEQVKRSLGHQERRVLSSDEEHELGVRLHDRQRERTAQVMERLKAQYLLPVIPVSRSMTPDLIRASATRMHDETMARAKRNMEHLVQRYVFETEPPKKKLDIVTMQEMANRLSSSTGKV